MALNDKLLQSTTSADSSGSSINPRDHFGTVLYTGTDASHSVNGGKFNAGAGFNGSSSKIVLADNTFKYTSLTISAWIYPSGSGERVIIETYNWTGSPGSQGWILKIDGTTNKAIMRAYNGDCGSAYPIDSSCTNVTEVSSNSAISTSAWTHIAVTLDSSNMKMYIDGTAQTGNTSMASNGFSYHTSTKTNIGYLKYGSAADEQFFSGKIDQLRMYDEVLSASQVSDLASESYSNSFKVNFPTGKSATALYRFNGNANDETNYFDGTATNVDWKYGVNFTPDLVWFKARTDTRTHSWVDSVRGFNGSSARVIQSDGNHAQWESTAINSLDVGGFTVSSSSAYINNSSHNYVAWCWNAGGSSVTNNDGSLQSTVRANTDAGFSIVKYDYPHTDSSTVRTVGHGLNTAPSFMIVKNLEHASSWFVYSEALGNGYEMYLNNANGVGTDANRWNSTSPTTDVFTLGTSFSTYAADYYGGETIAYCFHDVAGYQKVGSYSPADQDVPLLIETGFKVGWILIKRTDSTAGYNWVVMDSTRDTTNPIETYLTPDATYTEGSGAGVNIDFLDDGFRLNGTDSAWRGMNATGGTFIYLAIAVPPETTTPTLAKSFKVNTWQGDATARNIETGFEPSFVWIKSRTFDNHHMLYDSIRGAGVDLHSNTNDTINTDTTGLSSFIPNGFSLGTSGNVNSNTEDFVSWSWKASDSTDILTAGSGATIDSLVSVNDEAGFSIVKYIGNNTSGATISHGLSAVPNVIITKRMDNTGDWLFYHSALGATKYLIVNSDAGAYTVSNVWNDTAPTSSVFSIGNYAEINTSGGEYIAYCWRAISSYSAFGSYTGDRPNTVTVNFSPTFQPDFVLIKDTTNSGEGWVMIDSVRGNNLLEADEFDDDTAYSSVTFTSTGFTVGDSGLVNTDNATIVYMAFKMN